MEGWRKIILILFSFFLLTDIFLLIFLKKEKIKISEKRPLPPSSSKNLNTNGFTSIYFPWLKLRFFLKEPYKVFPKNNQNLELKGENDLLLAKILVFSKNGEAKKLISSFEKKFTPDYKINYRDLKEFNPLLLGKVIIAEKEGEKPFYLVYFSQNNSDDFIIEIETVKGWVSYPQDFLLLITQLAIE
jgi:hypothetical protein